LHCVPPVIRVVDVSKEYMASKGALKVVDDANLDVEKGAFVTLIGPSGCGKSTLLNMIGGLISPTTGTIYIDDEEVKGPKPDKIAMVFQDPSLYPWRTVQKNVEFGLEVRGVPQSERKSRASKYLKLVGLEAFSHYYPTQISGGMQQRVSVARALALEPEVLLMDEPFGALDEQSRISLGAELTEIWRKTGKTIVFVTHSLLEAANLATHVAVMSARPGSIIDFFSIEAEWPRFPEDPEIVEARKRMWSHINLQSIKQAETLSTADNDNVPR